MDNGDCMERGLCHGRIRPSCAAERMIMFSLLYSEEKQHVSSLCKRRVEATSGCLYIT